MSFVVTYFIIKASQRSQQKTCFDINSNSNKFIQPLKIFTISVVLQKKGLTVIVIQVEVTELGRVKRNP